MFDGCSKVTDLDLSGIDVSKVATMAYMFNNCSNLQSINFTGWNTENLTNM
jgi:surface protein